ncbi:MAG: cytochrome c biogenesis protein CcdA [Minisyncoccia bacterium]|jgi:cytochrome c-type biogenesis protein
MTPLDPLALLPAAFIAGLLMFLAPCTLPIVPGYLAFISGSGAFGNGQYNRRGRVVINAVAFVLGFSVVFIVLGVFAGTIGSLLGPWRDTLGRLAGAIIIIFGLTMLGVLRIPILSNDRHMAVPHFLTIGKPHSSLLIGALFALGWSPCIGPILGSILLFAGTSATAGQGALLLLVFSLGLGVPFIASALLLTEASALIAKHATVATDLSMVGGALLVVLGMLMLFGDMGLLVTWGFGLFSGPYSTLLRYM